MAKATRIAFFCKDGILKQKYYTFEYFGGFAASQKIKCINSFHKEISLDETNNILEVSRKSENIIGNLLSAFNLKIRIKENYYPVECLYQSSKVFNDIQYKEVLTMLPGDAKRYVKDKVEKNKLILSKFDLFGMEFLLNPPSFFYDYLYILALYQNKELSKEIVKYDCFTDIEFNQNKQVASQARSCAIFKYLYINNILTEFLKTPGNFYYIYDFINERTLF